MIKEFMDLLYSTGWFIAATIIGYYVFVGLFPFSVIIMVLVFILCGIIVSTIYLKYYLEKSQSQHPNPPFGQGYYYDIQELEHYNNMENNQLDQETKPHNITENHNTIFNVADAHYFVDGFAICPKCKEKYEADLSFCSECGSRVS